MLSWTLSFLESGLNRSIRKIRQVNLFVTAETENSSEIRQDQIITTRLYIILGIISVTVLTIYIGLSQKTNRVLVKSPSIDDVLRLQSAHFNEFACPCSKITIPFGTFTSLNYALHEVNNCSSSMKVFHKELSVSRFVPAI